MDLDGLGLEEGKYAKLAEILHDVGAPYRYSAYIGDSDDNPVTKAGLSCPIAESLAYGWDIAYSFDLENRGATAIAKWRFTHQT